MSYTMLVSAMEDEISVQSLAKTASRVVAKYIVEQFVMEIIVPIIKPFVKYLMGGIKRRLRGYDILPHEHAS